MSIEQIDIKGGLVAEEDGSFTIRLNVFYNGQPMAGQDYVEKGFLDKNTAKRYLQEYGDNAREHVEALLKKSGQEIISCEDLI
jgi:hypothetical protein